VKRRLFIGLSAALLSLCIADALRAAWLEHRRFTPQHLRPGTPAFADAAEVSFQTADGVRLNGSYFPSHNGSAVVLTHGYGENRLQLTPEAKLLVREGYGVLSYDLRGHGSSAGAHTSFGAKEQLDVRAALDFLSRQPGIDTKHLGSLGFSIGATAALLEALNDPRVSALALEGIASSLRSERGDELGHINPLRIGRLFAELGMLWLEGVPVASLDARELIAGLSPRALLIVHGAHDPSVPVERVRSLYDAAHEPKQLVIVPNAGHGHYLEKAPELVEPTLLHHFASLLRPNL
jgi:uncharacterized protein